MRFWLLAASVLAGQSFERDVQPVFRKHCYGCHAANVKIGSLDVQTYEGILRGGNQGTIVAPGKAAESRLYLTLTGAMEPVMPMGAGRLGAAELAVIRGWIDAGARPDPMGLVWRGDVIAGGYGGEIRLFAADGRLVRKIASNVGTVRAVGLSEDGRLVGAEGVGGLRVYETGTGREAPAVAMAMQGGVTALSGDGRWRATLRADGSVGIEDVR